MISETEIMVMGFIALGGVVAMLPVVLLNKINISSILKLIGVFALIIVGASAFYLLFTDASLTEILSLKANSTLLPKRIFTVSYTMIVIFIAILPIAIIRNVVKGENE
jgi:hypothetical protein